jgi:coproporphyrinogen III oxidase-like Fe-S oxidoreductase
MAYAMLDRITERTGARAWSATRCRPMRAGHRCAHNLNYWQFGDYLGIGAGAHSKLSFAHRIVRQVRYREPRLYMDNALAGARRRAERRSRRWPTCRSSSCSTRCG